MKVLSAVYWDRGERQINQDSAALQQAVTSKGRIVMAVVSDGIGGLWEGENASGYITERLIENFYGQLVLLVGKGRGKKALKRSFLRCFYDINDRLQNYGKGRNLRLGATVSLLFVWRRNYMILHLGDSRIYLLRNGIAGRRKIKPLTKDHSRGARGLTRCMGSFPFQYPDISCGRIRKKSGFLLCTDGFYRKMDEDTIHALVPAEIGSEEQLFRRLKEVAALALKKGETDNQTAVYAMFS